jgi:hypothetical protein
MRQWELRSITHHAERVDGRDGDEPAPVRFPTLLWATDLCLGITATGRDPSLDLGALLASDDDRDLFDVFAPSDDGREVIEAHLAALRGSATMFRLRMGGRTLRCLAVPYPDAEGRTVGTICLALGLTNGDGVVRIVRPAGERVRPVEVA